MMLHVIAPILVSLAAHQVPDLDFSFAFNVGDSRAGASIAKLTCRSSRCVFVTVHVAGCAYFHGSAHPERIVPDVLTFLPEDGLKAVMLSPDTLQVSTGRTSGSTGLEYSFKLTLSKDRNGFLIMKDVAGDSTFKDFTGAIDSWGFQPLRSDSVVEMRSYCALELPSLPANGLHSNRSSQ